MKLKLHWQIFIAMALGAVFAFSLGEKALIAAPLGTIFIRLLKMIIVPLVLTSITTAVAGMGGSLGRVGTKTFGYYLLTSMLAILLGLVLANSIRPGVGIDLSATGEVFDKASLTTPQSLLDFIVRIIPVNVLGSAASGDILGVIFWSILFGLVITRLPPKPQEFLTNLFDYGFQAVMILTRGVIRLAPIGVFGLISRAVATSGLELFRGVALYMVTITAGLTIHLFVILPLVFFLFTRMNPIMHFRAMTAAMITAFSTSSSG
ncbi:MAG: cation:dicarboxylase symporter family transporter, partial [Candidatus Neomarinimicrobiota bacterium]